MSTDTKYVDPFQPFYDTVRASGADPALRLAWRVVHPDFTSSHGYRWPFPGQWASVPEAKFSTGRVCPSFAGDGLCLAKSWGGAASGGISSPVALICGYYNADVLGQDYDKLRVRRALVLDVVSTPNVLARAGNANLYGASLGNADLRSANLYGANLYGANLGLAQGNGGTILAAGWVVNDEGRIVES